MTATARPGSPGMARTAAPGADIGRVIQRGLSPARPHYSASELTIADPGSAPGFRPAFGGPVARVGGAEIIQYLAGWPGRPRTCQRHEPRGADVTFDQP